MPGYVYCKKLDPAETDVVATTDVQGLVGLLEKRGCKTSW